MIQPYEYIRSRLISCGLMIQPYEYICSRFISCVLTIQRYEYFCSRFISCVRAKTHLLFPLSVISLQRPQSRALSIRCWILCMLYSSQQKLVLAARMRKTNRLERIGRKYDAAYSRPDATPDTQLWWVDHAVSCWVWSKLASLLWTRAACRPMAYI